MNDLYRKSIVMEDNVYSNLSKAKSNKFLEDAYFDIACYDAQQAIEFILKDILKVSGVTFEQEEYDGTTLLANKKEGHDILYIWELVKEKTSFTFDKQDDLELLASTITAWETLGRYKTGIKTKEDTVRRIMNIYKNIKEEYEKQILCSNEKRIISERSKGVDTDNLGMFDNIKTTDKDNNPKQEK